MAWSVDTTVLDLPALELGSTFSPHSYGGQTALQPQQQLLQQYHMSDTHQQGGYAKPQLDVPYPELNLLSPGGESGYSSACSVGQASPMSRNVGGSPAPPRPSSRATPALDPDMENNYITSSANYITSTANILNNYGATGYAAHDSYNTPITETLDSFDHTYEHTHNKSFESPLPAGYSPPFVENTLDFPYSPQTSTIAYEPQQPQLSHSQPQHQQHLQEEEKQQFRVPPGEF